MSESSINVMVVDDSAIIRGLFSKILESDPAINVATTASHGKMAINYMQRKNETAIDVITLDLDMPVMDGLTAIPEILKVNPDVKIVIVSTLSMDRVEETMKALSLGAVDYLTKPVTRGDSEVMRTFSLELVNKVKGLASCIATELPVEAKKSNSVQNDVALLKIRSSDVVLRKVTSRIVPDILAIGSSTGGPQALTSLFSALSKRKIQIPIFLTQHMPPHFTTLLAKQIESVSSIACVEATDGESVVAGKIYLAPGDYHMVVKKEKNQIVIHTNQTPRENFCRPSVDPMLRSLFDVYGERVLVLILTGMGADGYLGSKQIADGGGRVIAQDEKTSVVWGMPGAVATGGLCTEVLPLEKIPDKLIQLFQGQI